MDLLRARLAARGHHRPCFGDGGDSSSTSTQNTTNTYTDNRQVNTSDSHANNSVNTDSSSKTQTTTTNTQVTDFGVLGGALQTNVKALGLVVALTDELTKGQNEITKANLNMARDLAGTAASAYSDATSQASGTKNLVMAGLVVIGLAAVMAFSKG